MFQEEAGMEPGSRGGGHGSPCDHPVVLEAQVTSPEERSLCNNLHSHLLVLRSLSPVKEMEALLSLYVLFLLLKKLYLFAKQNKRGAGARF